MKWVMVSKEKPQGQDGSLIFCIWNLWAFRDDMPSRSLVCRVLPNFVPKE